MAKQGTMHIKNMQSNKIWLKLFTENIQIQTPLQSLTLQILSVTVTDYKYIFLQLNYIIS